MRGAFLINSVRRATRVAYTREIAIDWRSDRVIILRKNL
jgi:hypothetical protein